MKLKTFPMKERERLEILLRKERERVAILAGALLRYVSVQKGMTDCYACDYDGSSVTDHADECLMLAAQDALRRAGFTE